MTLMPRPEIISLQRYQDDDVRFIDWVEAVIGQTIGRTAPEELYVIKIDNWFGRRWLGFAGKVFGALGVRKPRNKITLPPFIPSRVVYEQRFTRRRNSPAYVPAVPIRPLHIRQESGENLQRRLENQVPQAALFWYSGDSKNSGRGSLMAYIPTPEEYLVWYLGASRDAGWKVVERAGDVTRELPNFGN